MQYVIYLSTGRDRNADNDYGYYAGTYRVSGETFPAWDSTVTFRTKKYKSRARAEAVAKKAYERCGYVVSYTIEQVD